MAYEGFVKLHRFYKDNPIIMKDADHFAIWCYLLMEATHAEYPGLFKGKPITLQPGQLITGCISIGNTLNVHESKVRRVLNEFKSVGLIDRQTSNKNSLVSLLNWKDEQKREGQNVEQVSVECSSNEGQVTTNKNVKNVKNEKKNISGDKFKPPTVDEVRAYCNEKGFDVDAQRFMDYYNGTDWHKSNGEKIRYWKSVVATWNSNSKQRKEVNDNAGSNNQNEPTYYPTYNEYFD